MVGHNLCRILKRAVLDFVLLLNVRDGIRFIYLFGVLRLSQAFPIDFLPIQIHQLPDILYQHVCVCRLEQIDLDRVEFWHLG